MSETNGAQKFRPEWGRTQSLNWFDQAACKNNPQAEYAFLHGPAKQRNQAIQTFCMDACPVRKECGQFGSESMSVGVWGGEHIKTDSQHPNDRRSSVRAHERDGLREDVAKMYRSGLSIRRISRMFRRSDYTVKLLIVEAGLPLRGCKEDGGSTLDT